jgi:hypothetical protein
VEQYAQNSDKQENVMIRAGSGVKGVQWDSGEQARGGNQKHFNECPKTLSKTEVVRFKWPLLDDPSPAQQAACSKRPQPPLRAALDPFSMARWSSLEWKDECNGWPSKLGTQPALLHGIPL